EASARFYVDEDGSHIHSFFLHNFEEQTQNITVAFNLHKGRLFTIHEEDLAAFRLFRLRARRIPDFVKDATDIMLTLYETEVELIADELEQIYAALEGVSQSVLSETIADSDMEDMLAHIASQEDLNGKARLSLMDIRRALSFLLRRGRLLDTERTDDVREILRDIESLTSHTSFLFDKVNFLMDAAMGFINLAQNKIIKIFSIAAVVFLPPTLVASIYGMNFQFLPELQWEFGYPLALVLMVLSGLAPYWYFKRKGWL
ncbi:MAG TPA: magnesium/cobalt transporter CorA, partial [Candidatus Competibacteraceae bacterium]|nr:magnesium/cobalt transporter CorA [Candidatus Competibacteraceae bacterium]